MATTRSPSLRRIVITPRACAFWRLMVLDVGPDDLAAGADEDELLVLLGHLLDRGDVPGLATLEADQPHALADRGACARNSASGTRLP